MILEKKFNFLKIEKLLYKKWESSNSFKPIKSKESYCIMMPPPNVTGSLHMGHALTFTIQDILIRFNRMQGKEVLWQPGTDHAGIATQMIVEKQLHEKNISKEQLGREKFIEKVWEWKKESGGKISNQLRRLGASADWSREKFTMDDDLSIAVIKAFVDLYNENLIYKDKRLVNWDPKLLTAISDLEVDQREQEGTLWHIKYPIDKDNFIIVATTRPETMFGDTAIAVHPEDARYSSFIGKKCELPLTNRKIKIISDKYADPEKGSGAVKITPAHDFNDFEVGKRNNLEFINIFTREAKLNSNVPDQFRDLDRYKARDKILKNLKQLNLLVKEEKQLMVIPYGDRSGIVIEPFLTEQWFCDAKKLSLKPIDSVKNNQTIFIQKQWKKTFFNWMNNIQPWCISRQLWWGHQIPAWYGPDKKIFVAMNYNDAHRQANIYYKKDVILKRDEDVLDTWFSSALWTFSTLDWPKKTYELDKFYPSNVLVTGFDIIFFWVARMMMMGNFFMKKIPFKDVYIHPLIRDEKGKKMSKSKGNVIDPLDLIDKYGADTLRFTLTSQLNSGRDIKLSESRVKGYGSFINKIWNAANYLIINKCLYDKEFKVENSLSPLNQWLINELFISINNVNNAIVKYQFHEVANEIYHFVWHQYCDWYVELTKSIFQNKDENLNETKKVSIWAFVEILKMIHPIMPFISEYLWEKVSNSNQSLITQRNKSYDLIKSFNSSQTNIHQLINIISKIRTLRSELNIPYKKLIDIEISNKDNTILEFLKSYKIQLNQLLKINNIEFKSSPNVINNSAYVLLSKTTVIIHLKDIIDTKVEIAKMREKRDKFLINLNELDSKLSNKIFIQKAPQNIVDKYKKESIDIKSSIEKIDQIIDTIR